MIHIIMCTYNAEKYIWDQLESIRLNDFDDIKIHIFDDISDDGTLDIIKKFSFVYQDIKITTNVNTNKLGAWKNFLFAVREVGSQMSTNDYIMLCDQDDYWKSNKISLTYKEIKILENKFGKRIPLLVSTDSTLVDEDMNILSESFAKRNKYITTHSDLAHALMENHVQGCTVMINNALAKMVKIIPQNAIMHDSWLALIALSMGHVAYIDEPTMFYRNYTNSVTGDKPGYWKDIISKFSCIDKQRKIVLEPIPMYSEFLEIYGEHISRTDKEILSAYIGLEKNRFLRKRYDIIKYSMWKSGCLRNIGLLVLI